MASSSVIRAGRPRGRPKADDGPRRALNVEIPAPLYDEIQREAKIEGETLRDVVIRRLSYPAPPDPAP